jgi:hypothetical protein
MTTEREELYLAAIDHLLRFARIYGQQREYFLKLLEDGRASVQKRNSPQQLASGAGGGGSPP